MRLRFSDYDRWKLATPPEHEPRTMICGKCQRECIENEEPDCPWPDCSMREDIPVEEDDAGLEYAREQYEQEETE